MVHDLYRHARTLIDEWHASDLDFFPSPTFPDDVNGRCAALAYFNYQTWHYEDLARSPDPATSLSGYRGTIDNNKGRNECVEKLDDYFFTVQVGTGEGVSETLGMILDRLTILYLKKCHAEKQAPERVAPLGGQINYLLSCGQALYDGMVAGTKQCAKFAHLKLYN